MEESRRIYIPPAGHDWALPLYDPIVTLLGGDQAEMIESGHRSRE